MGLRLFEGSFTKKNNSLYSHGVLGFWGFGVLGLIGLWGLRELWGLRGLSGLRRMRGLQYIYC